MAQGLNFMHRLDLIGSNTSSKIIRLMHCKTGFRFSTAPWCLPLPLPFPFPFPPLLGPLPNAPADTYDQVHMWLCNPWSGSDALAVIANAEIQEAAVWPEV